MLARFRGKRSASGRPTNCCAFFFTLLGTTTIAHAQEGLRPIRGPILPGFWEENATWAIPAIIVGGLLLLFIAWKLWKKATAEKVLSPKDHYRYEVSGMEKLLVTGHTEEVPSRLSRVLREYIEASTGLRAPEQTTEEFLSAINAFGNPKAGRSTEAKDQPQNSKDPQRSNSADGGSDLGSFLALMDEAKYAGRQLTSEETRSLIDSANQFVATHEEGKRSQ